MILIGLTITFAAIAAGFFYVWMQEKQESEKLRRLVSLPSDVCCYFSGNYCVMASPQLENYIPSESLPLTTYLGLARMFSKTYWDELTQSIDDIIQNGVEFSHICKVQGDSRWVRVSGSSLTNPGEWCLWIKDVTEEVTRNQEVDTERHTHETMLNTLRSLLDTLPFLVWHRDESQKINYCNKYYSDAVQVSQREVANNSVELVAAPKARALARQALNTLKTQRQEHAAIIFGERKKIEIFEEPNPLRDGTIGYAIDRTEIEETKSTLGKIIDSFSDILDHQSTSIAIYGSDARLSYFNKAYQTLNGLDEEWLQSGPRLDEVLDELRNQRLLPEFADFPAYKKQRLKALHEQLETEEELIHLPNGRTLRSITTPHPTGGLLYMIEDVTDHLKLESRNKALMEVQETTLENLYEGVIVCGSDSKIKLSNPSFRRLWSLEESDVEPGQHLSHVIDKIEPYFEYDGDWTHLKARIMENTTDRIPKTGQIHRKDNTVLRFLYIPLPNGDNLLSYIDITDNSRVQDALHERNEALKAADQLKSEFIASVSYELRSPLNTICGFTELLYEEYHGDLNNKQREYVNGILNSSTKLLHLVNNLLDLGSIEAGHMTLQPESKDVRTVVKGVVDLMRKRAADKKIEVNLRCPKDGESWLMDEKRIQQALFNLILNSIQFTPEGGKITISANIKDDHLYLYVTDNGIGIPKEDQEKIFTKFERGPETENGAGLGLSLVKSLIELHGGTVEISSKPKKGTKVTCTLPRTFTANQDDAGTPLVVEYSK